MAVRMTHPESGGAYDADPLQVPHLRATGWQVEPGQDEQGETWPAELQPFEGQQQVHIRHPVTGGEAVVAEAAVPHWRSVGWQVVDDEPAEAEAEVVEEFTVPQLRQLARDRGISPIPTTKAELLAALSGDQEPATDQAGEEPAEPEEAE